MDAKESLIDLNSLLFEQLERIGNPDLEGEELLTEIERTKAVTSVSSQIIQNASVILKAAKFRDDRTVLDNRLPKLLCGDENE